MRILNRNDVAAAVDLDKVLEVAESVYTAKAKGETLVWPTVFYDFCTGEKDMDIKSGCLKNLGVHGLKMLNFTAENAEKKLPTLVGVILVCDTETGLPMGLLDAGFITGLRTGCAGAIGAKYLARKNSETLFLLGAGNQAFFQAGAFVKVFPRLRKVYVADPVKPENAVKFVSEIKDRLLAELKVDASAVCFEAACGEAEMAQAVSDSDMIVTVTPARKPVIKKEWVKPGTHLSCVGSDMSGKEEVEAEIFRDAVVYADDLFHCIEAGEMEMPLKSGVIAKDDLKGEIGQLILGETVGRTSDEQITIFDPTGMALSDIAVAKAALESAAEKGIGCVAEF